MPYLTQACPDPEPLDCRILTAALDLFVEQGYHNVSVHEIQKRADVSIGSIYKHFGGKEGVADALYTHILGELDQLIDGIMDRHDNAADRCQAIIESLFQHTETHRNIIAYIFHTKHADFLPQQAHICESSPFLKMRAIVEQGIQRGELRQTAPWVATACIFGGMARLIQLRLDGSITAPLMQYRNDMLDVLWNGMVSDKLAQEIPERSRPVAKARS